MGKVQHAGAKQLLDMVSRLYLRGNLLSYASAAERLGRPRDHARAVAQMCDLLDAAAAYAGTPLLALVAVRAQNGEIKPNAWKREVTPERRERIIAHSLQYDFGLRDYQAIADSLDALSGLSNREAWKFVREAISDEELFSAIMGGPSKKPRPTLNRPDQEYEALEGNPRLLPHLRSERDPKLVRLKKESSKKQNGGLECEACGANSRDVYPGLRTDPWEAHHREPLSGTAGEVLSRITDLAILCPSCHRSIHRTRPMLTVEEFRRLYFNPVTARS